GDDLGIGMQHDRCLAARLAEGAPEFPEQFAPLALELFAMWNQSGEIARVHRNHIRVAGRTFVQRDELAADLRGFEGAGKNARKRILDDPSARGFDAHEDVHAERSRRATKKPSPRSMPGVASMSARARRSSGCAD